MNLSAKIKKIGFPNPVLPDDESRSLHESLIKENWTYRKEPNPRISLKQRVGECRASFEEFCLGFFKRYAFAETNNSGCFY